MQQDLVSIIVTTYKRPVYLRKTLVSILNQTYRNTEILVVTDGFSEEDKALCASFADERIHHIEIDHAGCPAVPRNVGIAKSKGSLIAFCDDDDIWLPEKIHYQVDSLQSNPSAMLSYTNVSYIDENDQPIDSVGDRSTNFKANLYKNNIALSSVLIRKSVLENVPSFDERMGMRATEDFLFLARILSKFNFTYIDAPLLQYRIHQQGISYSKNSAVKMLRYYKRIYLSLVALYKEGKINLLHFFQVLLHHGCEVSKIILYPHFKAMKNYLRGKENV